MSPWRWFGVAACGLALLLLTLQPYSVCPFAVITGLPCPGCGLTRSLLALVRGEWGQAWRFHPLGPIVAGVALSGSGALLIAWRHTVAARRFFDRPQPAYLWWGATALVIGVWLTRFAGAFGGPAEVHSPFELVYTLNLK